MAKRNPKSSQGAESMSAMLLRAQKLARDGDMAGAADTLEGSSKRAKPEERARQLSLAARFLRTQDPERAARLVEAAIKASPKTAPPWMAKAQLADATRDKKGYAQAALHALESSPTAPQRLELGLMLARVGEEARALEAAKSGYDELGKPIEQATVLLRISLQTADWVTADALTARMIEAHRAGQSAKVAETPRTHLLWCADEEINLAVIRAFAEKSFPAMKPLAAPAVSAKGRRMRIGYLSSDYRDHATSLLVRGLMRNHDREKFELFAYCTGWDDRSALRRDMLAYFDHVRIVSAQSDKAAAQGIAADKLDVLVDLNGLTEGTRMGIMAWRPAPVQVSYLGFPGSAGGRFIDYVVADAHVLPAEAGDAYPERLIRLQRTYQINDYAERKRGPIPTRESVGLPPRVLVAGMFNNINKVGSEVWATWMEILRAVPGVLLWVLDPGLTARKNLVQAIKDAGLDPRRLLFAPKLAQESHIARMQCCDLILDPWPYGGHTSTADAIFAGIPVVAMEGSNFASRVSSSLLHSAGLGQLVNADREAYVKSAINLLTKPELIAYSKQFIRETSVRNDVFNARSKTRQLEAAFHDVNERAAKGATPRNVTLRMVQPPGTPAASQAKSPATPTRPPTPVLKTPLPRAPTESPRAKNVELVLVCGPWSSGTSAVAGLLANLGLEGLGPYLQTRDERTKNSYESTAFREMVMGVAAEDTVALKPAATNVEARLREFRAAIEAGKFGPPVLGTGKPFFLKYPLSAALIPQLCRLFNTKLVYVLRPVREIEVTRVRRGWPSYQGAAGAQRIYSHMFSAMVDHDFPTNIVRYNQLVENPTETARDIARFIGLDAAPGAIEKAAGFIRKKES